MSMMRAAETNDKLATHCDNRRTVVKFRILSLGKIPEGSTLILEVTEFVYGTV